MPPLLRETYMITTDCGVVTGPDTLTTYDPAYGVRKWNLVSNTYVLERTDPYDSTPPEVNCLSNDQVHTVLYSNYDYMMPIYSTVAIFSAVVLFLFAYRLIIYPFFRKR